MPDQLDWEVLGSVPGAAGARPLGSSDVDADADGANQTVNQTDILDAYNRGEIGKPDYDFLTKKLAELRSPEGAALAAKERAFVFGFKPVVDPDSPHPAAIEANQTYQLAKALDRSIERMRAAGKDPGDLFDAAKLDYIKSAFDPVPQFIPQRAQDEPAPPSASPDSQPAPDGNDVQTKSNSNDPGNPTEAEKGSADPEGNLPDGPPPDPSLLEHVETGIQDALEAIGISPNSAGHVAELAALGISLHPLAGALFSLDDLKTAVHKRDIPGILLAAAGFVPGVRAGRLATKALSHAREAEALASLGAARTRLVKTGLDRLAAHTDTPKLQAAVARNSARQIDKEVGFHRFETFKDNVGHAPPGYERHHIVNRHHINMTQFGHHAIHSTSNLILLPTEVHRKVSAAYSVSATRFTKGLILRDWLKPRSFDEQHRRGVALVNKVLREHYRKAP